MTEKAARHAGLRDHLPLSPKREELFRWRGNEVSRVEGFTDAVFAFAVTLLVVALEVPHTFDGLMDVVRGLPAFVICFTLLMTFWNAHYRFHRRYGMEDTFTRVITMAIIVLVLFFVYPLKFLFTMVTVNLFGLVMHNAPHLESLAQVKALYVIYGLGFAGAWGLYGLLYLHAYRARQRLGLDACEVMLTRGSLMEHLVYVGVCLLSVALALLTDSASLPGFIYFVLGPLMAFTGRHFGTKARALATAGS
ncbi:MAG: TMEM175 family protein [Pseudomonadota bacterium]